MEQCNDELHATATDDSSTVTAIGVSIAAIVAIDKHMAKGNQIDRMLLSSSS